MAETPFVERLTPLDLLMPGGYVGAVLVFPTTQPSPILLITLQTSLDLVCKRVPWLMGRLFPISAAEGQKPTLEIRWTARDTAPRILDKGSLPVAYEGLSRIQIPLASIPADVWPARRGVQPKPGSEPPVFAASLFHFADGKAVGLCIQGHHNTMDGFGFAEIVNMWARYMNESESQISSFNSPLERNTRLSNALDVSSKFITRPSLDVLFERHPEYSRLPPELPTEVSVCTSEILTIPMKKIEEVKQSLKPYLGTTSTTNTVACTLLWSAITRARMRRTQDLDNKSSRLPMAVNGRKRLNADLTDPQNPYLGNMVLFSLAEMAARDVSDCGRGGSTELLADVCRIVAQAQSPDRIDAGHIREVYSLVEGLNDYRSIFPGWELFGSRDLFITSWADLNMYDFDFGDALGKPQFVRIPYAQADGNVIILPRKRVATGAASEYGLEVVVMLQRDDLEALKEDSLWEAL
jgi:hypothetical protein